MMPICFLKSIHIIVDDHKIKIPILKSDHYNLKLPESHTTGSRLRADYSRLSLRGTNIVEKDEVEGEREREVEA